ncbi:hypothetical protein AMJ85_06905 [candidate division BRC1 bacterium SM23_51]|nr:MAG: hypothetical protein AMJ85_06905 [candidate division BRC1 bacterium SM23_51]
MAGSNRLRDHSTAGLICDVDGVLVNSPHERTWGETLAMLFETNEAWRRIRAQTSWDPAAYTQEVYLSVAAGKPRRDGARDLLEYFGVPDENEARLDELYQAKQEVFLTLVDRGEFEVFDDGVRFVLEARARGYRQAAASSSKNATRLLEMVKLAPFCAKYSLHYEFAGPETRLADMFEADVCGHPFPHGKPAPDIFLGAAAALDIPPTDCIVFEDAVSGVQAAKAGAMLCVGVARLDDEKMLEQAGADAVVSSLEQLTFEQLESLYRRAATSRNGTH